MWIWTLSYASLSHNCMKGPILCIHSARTRIISTPPLLYMNVFPSVHTLESSSPIQGHSVHRVKGQTQWEHEGSAFMKRSISPQRYIPVLWLDCHKSQPNFLMSTFHVVKSDGRARRTSLDAESMPLPFLTSRAARKNLCSLYVMPSVKVYVVATGNKVIITHSDCWFPR